MAKPLFSRVLDWLGNHSSQGGVPPESSLASPGPPPVSVPVEAPVPVPLSEPPGPARAARPDSPIRVAVDLSNLRPGGENGGVKPFLFETLLWLGRQTRHPLQMLYLTCSRTHAEVRDDLARLDDEVCCVRDDGGSLPRGDERSPRERRCISPPPDLLRRLGAHVLYCPFGPVDFAWPGIGTISTVVDVLHRDFPWSLTPRHNEDRERTFQQILAGADRMQCISHHVVSRMHAHYAVPENRMFTVYIAVHQRFAAMGSGAPVPVDPAVPSPEARPFFFYPANAWRHKNHETLLLAYGIYRAGALGAGQVPWSLVLTGYEDERWRELRTLADTLGLLGDGGVEFRGYVPPHEFGQLWETAGALVFPSLHEGFGIPLLEAMQHGLPILTSRDGSLPEVGADACLYADARRPQALAEGMTRLATDADLRADLVAAGHRRLVDFSLDHESGHLLDAVTELAAAALPYRPFVRGLFPDGWMEREGWLALPAGPVDDPRPARLTLRLHPLPAARRLRLRLDADATLGGFDVPAHQPGLEISVVLPPTGGVLALEVPDAANLNAADARCHGVCLQSVVLRLADGREFSLFADR